jgi:hypothetical protein
MLLPSLLLGEKYHCNRTQSNYYFDGNQSTHDCDIGPSQQKRCRNILLDGGLGVNITTKELQKLLGLFSPKPTPYTFRMADQTMTKSVKFIKDFKIQIHGISYIVTFMIMNNNVLDYSYLMLLSIA